MCIQTPSTINAPILSLNLEQILSNQQCATIATQCVPYKKINDKKEQGLTEIKYAFYLSGRNPSKRKCNTDKEGL